MSTFNLPDLGEGLQEAEIVSWLVSEGDRVVADQPMVSVETDKAVVEVPAPQSGTIKKLHGAAGEMVKVGAALVEFADNGAGAGAGAASEGGGDSGTVVGEIATSNKVLEEKAESGAGRSNQIKATPAVRALARKLNVDLAIVDPTGTNETITAEDVKRAAATLSKVGALEPLQGPRRAMAQRMAQAHAEVVPATLSDEADIHAWFGDDDITVRLAAAIVAGVKAAPALNVWYEGKLGGRHVLKHIDLGMAVDTPDGLFVPVLREVAEKTGATLRAELDQMIQEIKDRSIPRDKLIGPTITLSNFGAIGGRHASLVVVPPSVAIIGAGRVRKQAVPAGDGIAVHPILPLSITVDHRAITGGEAARFLAAMIADLEAPKGCLPE